MERTQETIRQVAEATSLGNGELLWSLLLLGCAGLVCWGLKRSARPAVPLALGVLLVMCDLGIFAARCAPTRPGRAALALPGWLTELPREAGAHRLLIRLGPEDSSLAAKQVFSLMPATSHIELINPPGGSQGLARNKRLVDLAESVDAEGRPTGLAIASALNVTHILSPVLLDDRRLRLLRAEPFPLYENRAARLRFYVGRRLRVVAYGDEAGVVRELMEAGSDPKRVVVENQPPISREMVREAERGTGARARVTVLERAESREAVEVCHSVGGLLVAGETWYPGWSARLDGSRAALWRANGLFRGVWVPSGCHVVEFQYQPRVTWVGMALSGATASVLLACALSLVGRWSVS